MYDIQQEVGEVFKGDLMHLIKEKLTQP